MIVYVVEEGFFEPSLCGVYTTVDLARAAIDRRISEKGKHEYTINPYHVDGEIDDSAALWFVHRTIRGNCFADPTDMDCEYPIGEAWVEEISPGEYAYNMLVWADNQRNAEFIASIAFTRKAKELGI